MAKKELEKFALDSYPLGFDNFNTPKDDVFQLPIPDALFPQEGIPRLTEAVNITLDNSGKPRRRKGLSSATSVSSGKNIYSGLDLIVYQDGGTIKRFIPPTTVSTLVSGLSSSAKVKFHQHADRLLWTNGITKGQIYSDGSIGNWGLSVPPVATVGSTSGSLMAGTYLVAVTLVDAMGVEHAANKSAKITITDNSGITVNLSSYDTNAVYKKIYCSLENGEELFYVGSNAVASTYTITNVDTSYEPLRTQALSPPLIADNLFSYRGSVMLIVSNAVFPSVGPYHHLYEIDTTHVYYPEIIIDGAGLDSSFWCISSNAAYWTNGNIPEEYNTKKRDSRVYAAGHIILSGDFISTVKSDSNIIVFISEDGPMIANNNGAITPLFNSQIKLDVKDKTATFAVYYDDDLGIEQLIFTLE